MWVFCLCQYLLIHQTVSYINNYTPCQSYLQTTTTNAIKDATLWHVALCMKMSTWVPLISQQGLVVPFLLGLVFVFSLYPPAMCASLPCWVDNLSCLWRSHLLSVAGPLGFFTKATGITVPRKRKWQSVQKSHSIALGGWYSLEQCGRRFIIAYWGIIQHLIVIPLK